MAGHRRALLVGALVLAVLLGRLLPPAAGPGRRLVETSLGAVEVVDGDTVRLPGDRRVRLAAIDAPERGRPLAEEAAAFIADRLGDAQVELAPADPPSDRYGRLLADLVVDGESLSEALLEEGLAWVYEDRDPVLLAAQRRAIAAGRGVHARIGDAGPPPFVTTRSRFHRADCPHVAGELASRDLSWQVAPLLEMGLSPCRTCLPWPP
jgi:endonuclease YncB( thermonuclease family)